jgi:transposase InsO family protein
MPESHRSRPSDPHRWLRRNRFQEGPDFLFLATQNGRPVEAAARRRGLGKVRFRMRALRLAGEVGVDRACETLDCSRASLFRWQAAFDQEGIAGLVEESRRPHRLRRTVPNWVDMVIVAIRLNTYWNSKRISAEMERRGIYRVGADHIDQLFRSHGCSRGSVSPKPGPRYERSRPNDLWHIDIKGPFFINLSGRGYIKTWIVGLVDDHSRFVIGLRIHTDAKLAPILAWLDDCFEICGQPFELMSDNGSPFVRFLPGLLPTGFGRRLQALRIRHLRTQISTPWTNGKIEAFWAVLQSEVLDRQRFASLADAAAALTRFVEYYNYHRLSGVLGWITPAERYDGTPFTDRGFENIPALAHLAEWLQQIRAA